MKYFIVEYSSKRHPSFEGEMLVHAPNLSVAQQRFLDWLKFEHVWIHLGDLTFSFREIKNCILPLHPPIVKDATTDYISQSNN